MRRRNMKTRKSQAEAILAGLPAHVMDSCVDDMADAVVAMLLKQVASEMDDDADESSHLRQIQ